MCALCFGFSPTFWTAVFFRFLWGLLNGNIGVSKTYLAEISDDTNSAKAMALFGVIGGFGRTIGPVIGGFLSSPADLYPSTFSHTVFQRYPYALPSLVISTNCLLVLAVAYLFLTETLPPAQLSTSSPSQDKGYSLLASSEDPDESFEGPGRAGGIELPRLVASPLHAPADRRRTLIPDAEPEDGAARAEGEAQGELLPFEEVQAADDDQPAGGSAKRKRLTFNGVVQVKVIGSDAVAYSSLKTIKDTDEPLEPHPTDLLHDPPAGDEEQGPPRPLRYSNGSEEFQEEQLGDQQSSSASLAQLSRKISYLLGRREILISTLLYGTNALTMIATNEIFPLWVVTPRALGGFDFTSGQIGLTTMVCGVLAVVLQVALYPRLVEWHGTLVTYKRCALCFALGAFLCPMASLVVRAAPSPAMMWTSVIVAQTLLTVPASFVLVTVFVFINNSCYSQHRATVNGIGQTFASLGRLLGPFCAARLFAWSETNHAPWPFNFYFVFYLIGFLTLFNWYLAIFLPRSIERRKREPAANSLLHQKHQPMPSSPSPLPSPNAKPAGPGPAKSLGPPSS